jgi:hypothetical protein
MTRPLRSNHGDCKWPPLVRALSRVTVTQVDIETLKTLAMFCGVGLTVSLMVASYGVDLSAGFF